MNDPLSVVNCSLLLKQLASLYGKFHFYYTYYKGKCFTGHALICEFKPHVESLSISHHELLYEQFFSRSATEQEANPKFIWVSKGGINYSDR